MVETPQHFVPALESLWQVMDEGGYAPHLNATVKRFNGALFRNRNAIVLEEEDIRELWTAARRDWRDVEPVPSSAPYWSAPWTSANAASSVPTTRRAPMSNGWSCPQL